MSNIHDRLSQLRIKPLTAKQERRLVEYLDDEFLQLTRGYKKRTLPSTTVPTLHSFLVYARRLLAFILQIPPVDPSTSLRTQYLLRLTGEVLNAIPGYALYPKADSNMVADSIQGEQVREINGVDALDDEEEPEDYKSALRELLDWLDDLDQAWLAVLQSQVWDPETGEGVDLVLVIGNDGGSSGSEEEMMQQSTEEQDSMEDSDNSQSRIPKSTPISQTDVTRLRSLLVSSVSSLEEWLGRGTRTTGIPGSAGREDDVADLLERLGLLDDFDELFGRTTDFLGGFGGYVVEPESVVGDMVLDVDACPQFRPAP